MALRYNLVWRSLVEPALTLNSSAWSKIEAGRDSECVAAGGWASYRQSRRAQELCETERIDGTSFGGNEVGW